MNLEEARQKAARVTHLMVSAHDVRIDRKTIWGNPIILQDKAGAKARIECLIQYVRWLADQPNLLAEVGALRGKVLGCWCAPRECHGHVLATLAVVDTVEERLALLDEWITHLYKALESGSC